MTDDIVTRLRTSYNASLVTSELLPDEIEDMKKAADEIERLRNDVKVRDLQILANFRAMDAMHKELYGDAD